MLLFRRLHWIFQFGDVEIQTKQVGKDFIQFFLRHLRLSGENPQRVFCLASDDGVVVIVSQTDDAVVAVEMFVERNFQHADLLPAFESCNTFRHFYLAIADSFVLYFHGAVLQQRVFCLDIEHVAFKPLRQPRDFIPRAHVAFHIEIIHRVNRAGGVIGDTAAQRRQKRNHQSHDEEMCRFPFHCKLL